MSDAHNMAIVASVLAPQRPRGELLASLLTRAPQWVAGLAVIGLGVQLAVLVANLSGGAAAPVAAPAAMSAHAAAASVDVSALQAAQLFGAPPAATGTNAPITSMALVLVGVLAADDPAKGIAILGPAANAAKVYTSGSTVPGGAKLAGVYNDRVVLDRGGQLETLPLPRQRGGRDARSLRRRRSRARRPPSASAAWPRRTPVSWARSSAPRPCSRTDSSVAIASFPRRTRMRSSLALGLRSGDLVTHINGTPLDDPQRGRGDIQHTAVGRRCAPDRRAQRQAHRRQPRSRRDGASGRTDQLRRTAPRGPLRPAALTRPPAGGMIL